MVKHLILIDYYLIFHKKKIEVINMLLYQILAYTINGKI